LPHREETKKPNMNGERQAPQNNKKSLSTDEIPIHYVEFDLSVRIVLFNNAINILCAALVCRLTNIATPTCSNRR
jgi:hypothetical protein